MQQSRRLVLIRHAQAEPSGTTDAERALAPAGHRDAEAAGAWLATTAPSPDHAVVSAARRAQETWAALARGAGWSVEPDVSRLLYSAEPDTVLDLVRELPDDVGVVVVVGHNPTMASLATMLDDGFGDPDAGARLTTGGFPTCSVAVFDHDGAWTDVEVASARLAAFHVGRG